ncbi:MAG TPA: anhydro-N-acetylmuramic acid kinase [Methylotenera sp.]|nr:anhydro-N-acetylmuramic acid kinase [Methylotenera sp.]HPH04748.1 anhydro-N-acetylmuramic acid kinase [Methylotenera sp.]HPN01164.1 anhydro-N-acetylmuramic acid kinase [Methylotenera sp.]
MAGTLFIGLMSGTSLDGVDVALVDFKTQHPQVVTTHFLAFPADLRAQILALQHPSTNELEITCQIGNQLAHLYAAAVNVLLEVNQISAQNITAIGCHGQTIRHRPELGFTLQIGNNALLAELTNITVVGDFRSRDIAAGGQGAPLVPAFHQAIFAHPQKNRMIVNIGGIANITFLAKTGQVLGFDSGPGNMLIDSWTKLRHGKDYDANGAWAATGIVLDSLLFDMLAEPYFALPPPKSTGRDLFNDNWLKRHLLYPHLRSQDVARTLVELTAQTIVDAIFKTCHHVDEVYLCGGGAHNALLVDSLKAKLGNIPLANTDALGVGVDWLEAVAFAWLAQQTITGKTSNLPEVTGAAGTRILGAIYPN